MMAKNFRLVLRETVSASALGTGTTATIGLPFFMTTIGSFFTFCAYSDSGAEAFVISIFFIIRLSLFQSGLVSLLNADSQYNHFGFRFLFYLIIHPQVANTKLPRRDGIGSSWVSYFWSRSAGSFRSCRSTVSTTVFCCRAVSRNFS
jgi:hypothetical protein